MIITITISIKVSKKNENDESDDKNQIVLLKVYAEKCSNTDNHEKFHSSTVRNTYVTIV